MASTTSGAHARAEFESRVLGGLARTWAVVLVAAVVAAGAAPAFATTTKSVLATSSAPLATGTTGVQMGPGQQPNTTVVIVDVSLDQSVKLPARVRIPLPPGSAVMWAGEILGGDPSADPARDYAIGNGVGAQYVEFTMTQSHDAQIDTGGLSVDRSGTVVSGEVDFVQSVPSSSTRFSVQIPAGASKVSITPAPDGSPETNSAGESLYVLPTRAMKTGEKATVTVSYDTAQASSGSAGSRNASIFVALGVALVAVIIAVGLLLRRTGASADEDGSDDDEYDGDDVDARSTPDRDDESPEPQDAAAEEDLAASEQPAAGLDEVDDDPFSTAD